MKTVGSVIAPQLLAGLEGEDREPRLAEPEFSPAELPRALEKVRRVIAALLEFPFPADLSVPGDPEPEPSVP